MSSVLVVTKFLEPPLNWKHFRHLHVLYTTFTSFRIAFCSISQHYTVWCEYTFFTTFMLSMSLKTLSIILMCFDGKKKATIWKKYKRNYRGTNNKKMSRKSNFHFFWTDDAVASFICQCISNANMTEWTASQFVWNMNQDKKQLLSLIQKLKKKAKIFKT